MSSLHIAMGKPKISAVLLILIFVLPVGLAKLALEYEWFTRGATNKGELLQPVITTTALLGELPPKWRILYTLPNHCDPACQNTLYSAQQIWVALGKESHRVEVTLVVTPDSDQNVLVEWQNNLDVRVLHTETAMVRGVLGEGANQGLFLVDTLNNAMLRYPIYGQPQEAILQSRSILSDLKKLLKLSRIG
jgi:hypothetical protein